MFSTFGLLEPNNDLQIAYFGCVKVLYFVSFFYDHPVASSWPGSQSCSAATHQACLRKGGQDISDQYLTMAMENIHFISQITNC